MVLAGRRETRVGRTGVFQQPSYATLITWESPLAEIAREKKPFRIGLFWVLSTLLVLLVVVPLVSYSWKTISTSKDYI